MKYYIFLVFLVISYTSIGQNKQYSPLFDENSYEIGLSGSYLKNSYLFRAELGMQFSNGLMIGLDVAQGEIVDKIRAISPSIGLSVPLIGKSTMASKGSLMFYESSIGVSFKLKLKFNYDFYYFYYGAEWTMVSNGFAGGLIIGTGFRF